MLNHFFRVAGLLVTAATLPTLWAQATQPTTPIKYVVVIFQENNSFDHYFGTYPNALYPSGETVSATVPIRGIAVCSAAEHAFYQWPLSSR